MRAHSSNVIQGTYPQRPEIRNDIGPEPLSIMGNEGTGVIEGLPDGHNQFKIGDKGAFAHRLDPIPAGLIPYVSLSQS